MNRSVTRGSMLGLATMVVLGPVLAAEATTVAYYRFEEGSAGAFLEGNFGGSPFALTNDASGNGNHMRTFNSPPHVGPDTSPRYNPTVPVGSVPLTGAANNLSFHFGAGTGVDGNNDDVYVGATPTGTSLNADLDNGSTFTIEAWVRANDADRWATFIGRDNFAGEAFQTFPGLFYFQRSNDGGATQNHIKVQAENKAGDTVAVFALAPMNSNTWYHVAAVGDGSNLSLFIDGVLQNSTPFDGLFDSPSNQGWTIGRGFFNGPADFWDGYIDEVRFSSTALTPDQFLNAVPEPVSLALLAMGSLMMLARRRR